MGRAVAFFRRLGWGGGIRSTAPRMGRVRAASPELFRPTRATVDRIPPPQPPSWSEAANNLCRVAARRASGSPLPTHGLRKTTVSRGVGGVSGPRQPAWAGIKQETRLERAPFAAPRTGHSTRPAGDETSQRRLDLPRDPPR